MKTSQCRRASGLRDDTAPLRPALTLAIALGVTAPLSADDWPMLGRDATRNPLSLERNPPVEWDVETGKNLRWKARVGSIAFADLVVAGGLVWIGSNNSRPWDMSTTNGWCSRACGCSSTTAVGITVSVSCPLSRSRRPSRAFAKGAMNNWTAR